MVRAIRVLPKQQFLRHELCHRSYMYVQSNVYASAIDSAICKIVEVLGWVRNLVRITSALVQNLHQHLGEYMIEWQNSCLQFRLLCCSLLQGNNNKQYTTLAIYTGQCVGVACPHPLYSHNSRHYNVIWVLGVWLPSRWISQWPPALLSSSIAQTWSFCYYHSVLGKRPCMGANLGSKCHTFA